MNSKTAALFLPASKERVFSYLSIIKNLPMWATEFCRKLKSVEGKYKVVTPMGEMFCKITHDERTGVIDFFTGPDEAAMGILPVRVLDLPGGSSVTLFTMLQPPDTNKEQFDGQFKSLLRELENIKRDVL